MTDELMLVVRGTAAEMDWLLKLAARHGKPLVDDGPGQSRFYRGPEPLWKSGAVTQFVRKQVTA